MLIELSICSCVVVFSWLPGRFVRRLDGVGAAELSLRGIMDQRTGPSYAFLLPQPHVYVSITRFITNMIRFQVKAETHLSGWMAEENHFSPSTLPRKSHLPNYVHTFIFLSSLIGCRTLSRCIWATGKFSRRIAITVNGPFPVAKKIRGFASPTSIVWWVARSYY